MVKYGFCQKCRQPNTSRSWCQPCAEKEWQEDIKNLTGQEIVKKFIQQLGKNAYGNYRLHWIPYEWFANIEYLAEGGFGKVYKAKWKKVELHFRYHVYNDIVLKVLHDSQNVTLEFLTEVANNVLVNDYNTSPYTVKCWGISQDPKGNYVMVMDHIKGGNLREYLQQNSKKLNLEIKLKKLYNIAMGLSFVRQQNLVHRDLHPGNILNDRYGDGDGDGFDRSFITDVEPCRPTNYREKEGEIFGIPPYVAPEVILGQPYTPASDIYSFGIVAYELFANAYPHLDYDFGNKIICKIFFDQVVNEELRPNIDEIPLPKEIKDLITRCWNADPAKRPTAQELYRTLGDWEIEIYKKKIPCFTNNTRK